MAVYQKHFKYNGRSNKDYNLAIVSFNGDNGEVDSYLTTESIFTEKFDGTMRYDYGAKYSDPVALRITMVKENYADFSRNELRETLNWLTGLRKASWLDLYDDYDDQISFSFLGRVTNVKLQKMDARAIGVIIEFTSVSPWAYSPVRHHEFTLNGSTTLRSLCNASDEDSVYVYPNIQFVNKVSNGTLRMKNNTTDEDTLITALALNENIRIDSNKTIFSDRPAKVFGETYNFNWLRLAPGYNHVEFTGNGHIIIEYRDMYKVADAFDSTESMNTQSSGYPLLIASVQMSASGWEQVPVPAGDIVTSSQIVQIPYVTETSLINFQPTEGQIISMISDGVELQAINDDGVVTVYAYGGVPSVDYIMQATIEDTSTNVSRKYYSINLLANSWHGQGNSYTQPIYLSGATRHSLVDIKLTTEQIEMLNDDETIMFVENDNGDLSVHVLGYKPSTDYNVSLVVTETTTSAERARRTSSDLSAETLYF